MKDMIMNAMPFPAEELKTRVDRACQALADNALLAPGAFVYLETGADETLPELPPSWSTHREKVAGGVAYRLLIV